MYVCEDRQRFLGFDGNSWIITGLNYLDEVVASHVAKLEGLLATSAAARAHGVSVVQDLSQLTSWLTARLLDPRLLLTQSRAARFLFFAFPCRWVEVVIVDAPSVFGGLWRALKAFLPAEFGDTVRFLYRPEADKQLQELFGRRVL